MILIINRRWAVLSQNYIRTYETQDTSKKPTEEIPLNICRGVKSAKDDTKMDHSFRIDLGYAIFYFYAETEEEKEKWIGKISKNMIRPEKINHQNQEDDDDDSSSESSD